MTNKFQITNSKLLEYWRLGIGIDLGFVFWDFSPGGPSLASLLKDDVAVLLENMRDCVYGHKRYRAKLDQHMVVILSPNAVKAKDLHKIKTKPL